jgi:hypothetical protein
MAHARIIAATVSLSLVALVACSSDDAAQTSSSGGAAEAGASSGGEVDGGGTTPDGSSGGVADAGTDAPSSTKPGIQLTAAGTSYSLSDNPSAAQGGNGWIIGAAKIDGTKMRNVALILNKAEAGPQYVALTPGAYPCTMPGAAPFTWARFQYVTPDGSTYQSSSVASATACSVTLTEFGAVGQSVKGSFTATLDRVAGTEAMTVAVSGTFDVVRKN